MSHSTPASPITWGEVATAGVNVDVAPHARQLGFDRDVVVTAAAWMAVIVERDDAVAPMSKAERRRVVALLSSVPRGEYPAEFTVSAPDGSLVRLVASLDQHGDIAVALAGG